MNKLPASTGWAWLKDGFGLFRKQPGALTTLFLGYLFLMLLAGLIPFLGQLLPIILMPVFSIVFTLAAREIELERRIMPNLLISGFKQPAAPALLRLGAAYLITALIAIGASTLIDGGMFWKVISGQIDPKLPEVRESNIGGAILLAALIYIPAAMAFCFAAPLIYWQKLGILKAMFFSFFAVWRSLAAFFVFSMALFAISVFVSKLIAVLLGGGGLAMMLMLPMSVILSLVMHCSLYAAYRQIFGVPPVAGVVLDKPEY